MWTLKPNIMFINIYRKKKASQVIISSKLLATLPIVTFILNVVVFLKKEKNRQCSKVLSEDG